MIAFVRWQSLAACLCVASALTLAACGGSSTVTPSSSGVNAGSLGPDILQNGSPPPRWVVFQDNHLTADDPQLVVDPVGKVWFTEGGRLGFSTMDHRQGAVSTANESFSAPDGIAVGPDGKIWYTDYWGVVGTLTNLLQTATVVKYPTPGFNPSRIIAGPDGNLWVTLQGTDQIHEAVGKMSTSGVMTTYAVPTTSSFVWALAVGPDRNIWFSEVSGHKVGKLDPNTGAIVEYPVSPDFFPANIAWVKGSLYMTTANTGNIGVMDTAGNFSEVNTGLSDADDLGIGPDGNLWVTGLDGQHLALSTLDGSAFHLHLYPNTLDDFALAAGLVAAPDGNVWFVGQGPGSGPRCRRQPCEDGYLVIYARHELAVSPDTLTFSGTGQSQSIVATETHFTHAFSATTANPAVATVAAGMNSSTFVVTSTGTGTTDIDVSDGRGNSFLVSVTVSSARR